MKITKEIVTILFSLCMCVNEYETTDGVSVSVCKFTVYACGCVCVLK